MAACAPTCDFDGSEECSEDVLGLQVSIENLFSVGVRQGCQELDRNVTRFGLGDALALLLHLLNQLIEISVGSILLYHRDLVLFNVDKRVLHL